jgi:arginine/ornithine transport system permease protein
MQSSYFWVILQGAMLTVGVSLGALLVAVVLGLLGAGAKLSGRKPLVWMAATYTTLIRGVPDLVLMLLVFYGGTMGINALIEWVANMAWMQRLGWVTTETTIDIEPLTAGILTLGFIYGAYMTETFRGAILSIPKGQMEAAWAFGMGRLQTFMRITLPQMVRYALPGFTNNWLVLIKATALVSLIGLQEMTYLAKQAASATRSPFLFFIFTAVLFLIYTSVSLYALKRLNARYSLGTKRGQLS